MADMLKAALALGLVLLTPLVFSRGKRLLATMLASPFQIHLPGSAIGGFYPPIALLSALSLWPIFLRLPRSLVRWPPFLMLVLLAFVFAIALSWSVDTRTGIRSIVYVGVFLSILAATYSQDRAARIDLARLAPWLFAPVLIEAGLVSVFAFSPELEERFMSSELARLFINPNTLALDRTTWGDPQKAGGLIINANVAGTYLGMMSVVCAAMAFGGRKPTLYVVAAVLWVSVFLTGSKASSLLAVGVPVAGYALLWFRGYLKRRHAAGILTLHAVASLGLIGLTHPNLLSHGAGTSPGRSGEMTAPVRPAPDPASAPSLGQRPVLWSFGWNAFKLRPVRGLGFGGWHESLEEADVVWETMPPLNTVLDLWAKAGLAAAALGVTFMVTVLWFGWTATGQASDRELVGISTGTLLAFLWMFIQGMVENFGLLGEVHMAPAAAAVLGLTRSRVEGAIAASAGRA